MQDRTPDEVLKEEQVILGTEQGNIFKFVNVSAPKASI